MTRTDAEVLELLARLERLSSRRDWMAAVDWRKADEALKTFERSHATRPVRELVDEAERLITQLHSRECMCAICAERR